ncbi:MAG: hypothetical protein RLZZ453_911 [Chlamydiota bacterium]|jgi:hypothetical protein
MSLKFLPVVVACFMFKQAYAEAPRQIPPHLINQYTMNGSIPVFSWYLDDTTPTLDYRVTLSDGTNASFYSRKVINQFIEKVRNKEFSYYGMTDVWLYDALAKYPIEGKEVAILGSTQPWYESIVIAYGGRPVTIEYNKIVTDDDRLSVMTATEFQQNPRQFDVILSISSIEHDGLGRYGDPLNPFADLEFMAMAKDTLLKEGGAMILAVPIGGDCLYWNAHRMYGFLRLPMLLKGWRVVDTFGFTEAALYVEAGRYNGYQPVFYLVPE